MNSKKTFATFALSAILMISLTTTAAFALTAEEESLIAREYNSPSQSVSTSVFGPSDEANPGVGMVLAVDVSGSVDPTEFALQKGGYVSAFNSLPVQNAITFGCPGEEPKGVSASLVYWSSPGNQVQAVPFMFMNDTTSASAFATAINNTVRPFGGGSTATGSAINFSDNLFPFTADRQVIDVSGDGAQNSGEDTANATATALALGVDAINGVVISPTPALLAFYQNVLTGGVGSFVLEAATFADFEAVIQQKILLELCPPPVGGESLGINTASLMVAGIFANAIWIIPAVAGVAGVGAYLIRSRMNKD